MNTRAKVIAAIGLGAIACALLLGGALAARAAEHRQWTDGVAINAPDPGAPVRHILWTPSTPARAVSGHRLAEPAGGVDEYEPRISADGSTMVLVRRRPGSNSDLFACRRTPDGWTEPAPIDEVNSPSDELGPVISPDGTELFFYSDRTGGLGGYDIWVSKSDGARWGTPISLGPAVNTPWNEYGPALSPNRSTLYFSSNRAREGEAPRSAAGWTATLREERSRHDYDLYAADLSGGEARPASPIVALNTPADEGAPEVSSGGDFLYFASDRAGGLGGFDLWRSRIRAGSLDAPENLGTAVNSPSNDLDPALSSDGFRLHFSSDRPPRADTQGATGGAPTSDRTQDAAYSVWTSVSREVYLQTVREDRGGRLAETWDRLWPWLLLLLFMGLLALALIRILRSELLRRRLAQLSLLAKCVLISLLIHAIAASGMAVWKVGSGIIDAVRREGGTRVILASAGAGLDAGTGAADQLLAPAAGELQSPPLLQTVTAPIERPAFREASFESALPPVEVALDSRVAPEPMRTPDAAVPADSQSLPEPTTADSASLPATRAPRATDEAAAPEIQPAPATPAPARSSQPIDAPAAELSRAPAPVLNDRGASVPVVLRQAGGQPSSMLVASEPADQPEGVQESVALPRTASPAPRSESVGTDMVAIPAMSGPVDVGSSTQSQTAALKAPQVPSGAASPPPVAIGSARTESLLAGGSVASTPAPLVLETTGQAPIPGVPAPPHAERSSEVSRGREASSGVIAPPAPAAPVLSGGPGLSTRVELDAPSVQGTAVPLQATGAGPASVERAARVSAAIPVTGPSPGPMDTGGLRIPKLPEGPVTPVETFAQRSPDVREQVLREMGGSAQTERAVTLALDWFARHQQPDGRWDARGFDQSCGACGGAGELDADTAMTGLVLQCFLGAGHTHQSDGPYRDHVARALRWLVQRQAPDGDLRRAETMYGQTVATVALCEALAMTSDQSLTDPARHAVEFVLGAPSGQSGPARDTAVLGWLVMTVESARRAGIAVPRDTFENAEKWLNYVSPSPGRYAYTRGGRPSVEMTAESMFVRQLVGHERTEPMMQRSADFVLGALPDWSQGAPTHHWYYATLALFEHQGDAWKTWNEALVPQLLEHQRRDGAAAGSWDPHDRTSKLGGRIYQTAVCTLSLEVYYRYKPR